VFRRALHWSIFWARLIESMILLHPIFITSILILFSHLRLGLPSSTNSLISWRNCSPWMHPVDSLLCSQELITGSYMSQTNPINTLKPSALILSTRVQLHLSTCPFSGLPGFGLCPSSDTVKNTMFRKLDLFPSSGEGWEIPTLLGQSERHTLNHSCCSPLT
jgi:hypothetical protein